jgi:hypothetical protein
MIKCDTTFDKKTVAKIYKYYVKKHLRISISRTIVGVCSIFLILFGAAYLADTISFREPWGGFEVFMLCAALFGLFFLWYALFGSKKISLHQLNKQFLKNKQNSVIFHYTFDQKGIHIEKTDSSSFYSWKLLKKIWEQPDFYVFEIDTNRFGLIDKHGFKNNDHAEFQILLQKVLQPNQIEQHKLLIG